jgi:hypothetical protein
VAWLPVGSWLGLPGASLPGCRSGKTNELILNKRQEAVNAKSFLARNELVALAFA